MLQVDWLPIHQHSQCVFDVAGRLVAYTSILNVCLMLQDSSTWAQTRMRIVRNTSAGVKFASQIPGNQWHTELKLLITINLL